MSLSNFIVQAIRKNQESVICEYLGGRQTKEWKESLQEGLLCTVGCGHIHLVEFFLEAGADPNQVLFGKDSSLVKAIEMSFNEIVFLLLEKGADPNLFGLFWEEMCPVSPLWLAVKMSSVQVIQKLLDAGADVNGKKGLFEQSTGINKSSSSIQRLHLIPLIESIRTEREDVTSILIRRGADCNIVSSTNNSPLAEATLSRSSRVVSFLLRKGADPEQKNYLEKTVLHDAVRDLDSFYELNPDETILGKLTHYAKNIDMADAEGRSPLMEAAIVGNLFAVQYLLSKGANRYLLDHQSKDAFLLSLEKENFSIAHILLDDTLREKYPIQARWFKLTEAVQKSNLDSVHSIIHQQNQKFEAKEILSILDYAIQHHRIKIIKILFWKIPTVLPNQWSDKDLDELGFVLEDALVYRVNETFQLLIQLLSNHNEKSKKALQSIILEKTDLFSAACFTGNLEAVVALLELGADINQPAGVPQETPLRVAVRTKQLEIVSYLLKSGADTNHKIDLKQGSALHHAVLQNDISLVQNLIQFGAKLDSLDDFDRTPLVWAVYSGNLAMVKFLEEKGAKLIMPSFSGDFAAFDAESYSDDLWIDRLETDLLAPDDFRVVINGDIPLKAEKTVTPLLEIPPKVCRSALEMAVLQEDIQIIKWLLEKKLEVTVTAVHQALIVRNQLILETLMTSFDEIPVAEFLDNIMGDAIRQNDFLLFKTCFDPLDEYVHFYVLTSLLEKWDYWIGATFEQWDFEFWERNQTNDLWMLEYLLKKVNWSIEERAKELLQVCILSEKIWQVKLLFQHPNIPVSMWKNVGKFSLRFAIERNNPEVFEFLLSKKELFHEKGSIFYAWSFVMFLDLIIEIHFFPSILSQLTKTLTKQEKQQIEPFCLHLKEFFQGKQGIAKQQFQRVSSSYKNEEVEGLNSDLFDECYHLFFIKPHQKQDKALS